MDCLQSLCNYQLHDNTSFNLCFYFRKNNMLFVGFERKSLFLNKVFTKFRSEKYPEFRPHEDFCKSLQLPSRRQKP